MFGTDIKLTREGSVVIKNGDLDLDTDLDIAFTNRMLRCSLGSWRYDPQIGVGLQDYTGRPNTEATGRQIEEAVISGLRKVGIDSDCIVYPISFDAVAIQVDVFTPEGTRTTNINFRYVDGVITYVDQPTVDAIFQTRPTTNKYDRRG